jgi:hypothetical protein
MSITATIATHERAILLSDGYLIDVSGIDPNNINITPDRIKATDGPKIKKITPQTAVIWMGAHADEWHRFTSGGTPAHVAYDLYEFAISIVRRDLLPEPWYNINSSVLGYQGGELLYWQIVTIGEQIELKFHGSIPLPFMVVKNPFIPNDTALQKFKNHLKKQPHIPSAFQSLLNEIGTGLVGGTIFHETISNNGTI